MDVYAVNFPTTGGSATPAKRDAVLTAPAADYRGPACGGISALVCDGGQRWAVVSAAAAPVLWRWPGTADRWVEAMAGPVRSVACRQGLAEGVLAPRSWITSRSGY